MGSETLHIYWGGSKPSLTGVQLWECTIGTKSTDTGPFGSIVMLSRAMGVLEIKKFENHWLMADPLLEPQKSAMLKTVLHDCLHLLLIVQEMVIQCGPEKGLDAQLFKRKDGSIFAWIHCKSAAFVWFFIWNKWGHLTPEVQTCKCHYTFTTARGASYWQNEIEMNEMTFLVSLYSLNRSHLFINWIGSINCCSPTTD